MKPIIKRLTYILPAALAFCTLGATAQMGAGRVEPKPQKPHQLQSAAQCQAQVGQTIQPDDFQQAFDALKAQPGGTAQKSQYETQAQYEARLARNPGQTLVLARTFNGRYRAEEQRFELWYHDLMGKNAFPKEDTDRYVTLSAVEQGFSRGLGNRDFGGVEFKSTSFYDIQAIDITGPRPKRRAFDFPFRPEYRLKPAPGSSEAKYGGAPRPGSDKALNRLRWYLDMPGAEAQANDQAMKWAYQVNAKSAFEANGVSYATGATRKNIFDQRVINGQVVCAMILDRNNVVKKVFRVQ